MTSSAATQAPAAPALTAAQQNYVTAMRAQFNFRSSVADTDIVTFGQTICSNRSGGSGQATTEQVARSSWSNMSATDAYNMTRLTEQELCPAWLPSKAWHVIARYSGSGMWNSPPFHLRPGDTRLRVTFGYSGNSTGFGGDNFIADLVSSTDDISLANDIAVSGGKTTSEYPDLSFGGSRSYHLEVQADNGATWDFVIKQRY